MRGKPARVVAKAYGLTEASVRRHTKHIRAVVAKAGKQRARRAVETMVNVYDEYATDLRAINQKIAACKDDETCQGWYETKRKRLDMALKYRFLGEWLSGGKRNGKHEDDDPLPPGVQRVIDAVVNNDE